MMTEYTFTQLVDVQQLRKLLELHHALTGMTYAILDSDENILVAVGWQEICTRFHRTNPVSSANCRQSDAFIKAHLHEPGAGCVEYLCKNGMIDVAIPIVIGGKHHATLFTGQFFYEDDRPDISFFRSQAEALHFDVSDYLDALQRVPVLSRETVRNNMLFLCEMVKVIVNGGLSTLRVEREVEKHKSTERALKAHMDNYRTLAESSPDNIIRYDRQCRAVYLNATLKQTLHAKASSIIGKTPVERQGDLMQGYEEALRRVLETGVPDEVEVVIPTPSGPTTIHHVRIVAERGASGEITGGLAYGRDITERRRMEEELYAQQALLKQSELFFKETQRSASIGSYRVDFIDGLWDSSEVLDTIFGISKEYARTVEGWLDLLHPDDREAMERYLAGEVIAKRAPFYKEYRICRRNDGEMRWVLGLGQVKCDADGVVTSMFGTIQDISERKRVEHEQRLNERRMKTLYEISQYRFVNEADFLDHALEEAVSLTNSKIGFICFYSEEKRQFSLKTWSCGAKRECAVVQKKTVYDLDATGVWGESVRQRKPVVINDFDSPDLMKGGFPEGHVRLKRFLAVPIFSHDSIIAVVAVANNDCDYTPSDVMQLTLFMDSVWKIVGGKRMEEDRLKLEKQLLHAQKLESLGVLAGGIAHDFNNILVAIIGNADLALMKTSPDSPAAANLRRIGQAASRAADLSKQMLAYSGKGKFIVEHIDLNRVLEEMLHMLQVSISKKIELRLDLTEPLPTVEADVAQIHQVVMNLIINASEAIGDRRGVISVATKVVHCDRASLDSVCPEKLPEGKYVALVVRDTGCGMDRETIGRIFDPFFTTKFTGRGLGMAAVHGIVRGHKGGITVLSEPGKGSSFTVLLPASDGAGAAVAAEASQAEGECRGKVLLVDDEEDVRKVGCEMLAALGFEAVAANDGFEALEALKCDRAIKLVILDLTMPRMDGEQAFNELRRLDPDLKVILSSGYNEQEVTRNFAGKGLAGFIQKPYRIAELRAVLAAATS